MFVVDQHSSSCRVVFWGFTGGVIASYAQVMGRPPLAVGTAGKVRHYKVEAGWRARAWLRDYDGVTREIERTAPTKAAASSRLAQAVRDRMRVDEAGEIKPDTKVRVLADRWLQEIRNSDRATGTIRAYEDRVSNQVMPALGNLRIQELTTATVDRHLKAVGETHGAGVAKLTRTVLSGMCIYAARQNAMRLNPVREAGTIKATRSKTHPRSLHPVQLRQLRALVTYHSPSRRRDIVDLIDMLIASGLRIGECLAVIPEAIDLERSTVEVRGTVIRIKGQGLIIQPAPKSKAGYRTLKLPSWCVEMLRNRMTGDYVFASSRGTLRDPSNIDNMLSDAFEWIGEPWITSHVFRKSVATLMDQAGLRACW